MLWWLPYIVLSCELPSQTGVGDEPQRDAGQASGQGTNQITCDDLITTLNISVDSPLGRQESGQERKKLNVNELERVGMRPDLTSGLSLPTRPLNTAISPAGIQYMEIGQDADDTACLVSLLVGAHCKIRRVEHYANSGVVIAP